MALYGVSAKCGVSNDALHKLIAGVVTPGVAMRLDTTSSSLQTFINGGTSVGLAMRMGTTSANVAELRMKIGREGAIGLLIGLLAGQNI